MSTSTRTAIEWTDYTWNPITGCSRVSPGCDNCYAERLSERLRKMGVEKYAAGFEVTVHEELIEAPLRWRKPRMVFVNSMSDLFHEAVPDETIGRIFDVMAEADSHIFQVLTKRSQRMRRFLDGWVLDRRRPVPRHIWLGVSIETDRYTFRADHLRHIDTAGVCFVSAEPLLGPLPSLRIADVFPPIDWIIAGGESGPGHRPIDPDWVRDLRDRCVKASTPFFFKQWGGNTPKAGGRELDGREWSEMPELAA